MTPISPEQQLKLMELIVQSQTILQSLQDNLAYLYNNSHAINEKDASYLTHILENESDSFLQAAIEGVVTGMK